MTYTTYLRWGVITGLFLSLLVPFIIADGQSIFGHLTGNLFFPYITGKNFIFRIIVEVTLALYVGLAIKDPKYRPRASWIMWAALALTLWMAVATFTSADGIKSFWSNFERMEGYVGLMHLFVYFVIAGAVLTAENLWERFFNTSIGLSMYMGLYALCQSLHVFGLAPSSQSGARADTSFGNATYLAVYMLFNIFITLLMLVRRRDSAMAQSVYGVALVLQFLGLYLTETRGALLGAIGGLVIAMLWIALMARTREWHVMRKVSIGGIIALAVIAGTFVALRGTLMKQQGTIGRLASISLEDKTTRSRLFSIWPMAFKGAVERPVTGWGQENFSYVFNEHYTPSMWDQEQWFDRAHNQFLDWLIAGGFPALLIYLGIFALASWAVIRAKELTVPEQAVLLGLLAGYAFNNLFVFDNLTSSLYFFFILAYLHSLSRRDLPSRLWLSRPAGDHLVAVAAPVAAIAILVGGWALNAPGLARASVLVNTLGKANDPAASLAGFKQALGTTSWPGNPMGYQETVEQLASYASNSIAPSQATTEVKSQYYTLSVDAMQKLMSERKGDARLELFLSGFYGQFGQTEESIEHAKTALSLSPGKQQILFQLGLSYLSAGDTQNALAQFKQAYEEDTANDQALIYYAIGEYDAKDFAAGDKLLVDRFGTTVVDNDQLLGLYTQLKAYDRAIAIWKLRLDNDSKNTNIMLSLAGAYFAKGDKVNTIATLKLMQQTNPAIAGQVQNLIDQINSGLVHN